MRRSAVVNCTLGLALVVAMVLGLGKGPDLALAQEVSVPGQAAIQEAPLGTGFTYQGRVLYEGTAIDGSCDFAFSLWDAASDGTQHGTQSTNGVPVSDGYFTVQLDFGPDAFLGDDRYLEIGVDCGQGHELLQPRQALTAAPYAHSLRPGASVVTSSGNALNLSTSATSGAALNALSSGSSGNPAAVYGSSAAPGGAGVSGYNSSSGYGLYGSAAGSTGSPFGVYGLASHSGSATSFGVYGKSNSSVGTGVAGEAPMNGIYGKATAANGYGVYGAATASTGTNYGIYGKATSGKGVYGEGSTGVHGYSPSGAGVWGSSPDGLGVSGTSTSDYGVKGASTNSTGVYGTAPVTGTAGIATAGSGASYGLYGKATSLFGRGVYGEGGYYGAYAVGSDPNGVAYGVYGRTMSRAATASGVYGHAAATSGATFGVYGKSDSPNGYGVYSDGDAHVQGSLTVSGDLNVAGSIAPKTRTTTLAIAPAAFQPEKHDMEFTNTGYSLKPAGGAVAELQPFNAPLQLPHNARVTKARVCFMPGRTPVYGTNLRFGIERTDMAGHSVNMAFEGNPADGGPFVVTCFSDDTIQDAVIDSNNMAYYAWVSLTHDAEFYGMQVEYEYSVP